MPIFNFNRNKKVEPIEPIKNEETKQYESESFSGWRLELPNDSNLPIVYNQNKTESLVPFSYDGSTMMFPQFVEQSIYESAPSHSACIKLAVLATVGAGYVFKDWDKKTLDDKKNLEIFVASFKNFKKFIREITQDFRLHNRINIKVIKKTNGVLIYERVSPARIGYNSDKTLFFYSRDYALSNYTEIFKRYETGCEPGTYMIDFDGQVDKYDPYPAPEWISGFKHIKINSRIPAFHEANMTNSINPNLVIKRPTRFKDIAEKNRWFKDLFKKRGVEETGTTILFTASSKEELPEITQLTANPNDKLFKELRESSIDDICMAHNVNSVLIGVKTAGSLGANQESEFAWELFYNTVVVDMKEHIEYTIDTLLDMNKLSSSFELNEKKFFTIK